MENTPTSTPNADRLSVCKVDIGNETMEVVCGAPNARGFITIYAPIGSIIPKSKMVIQKLRLETLYPMECFARNELNINNENEGIIEMKS